MHDNSTRAPSTPHARHRDARASDPLPGEITRARAAAEAVDRRWMTPEVAAKRLRVSVEMVELALAHRRERGAP